MSTVLYSDKLVEIGETWILIRRYYFPFGSKKVLFRDIESITAKKPTLLAGKYRFWGTGDFRTWYPLDIRSRRDRIFIMRIKNRWWRIGFTVEDSGKVLDILGNKVPIVDH